MQALLALLPSAVVLVGVIGLRWSGLTAAAGAALATAAIWLGTAFDPPSFTQASRALADAAILTLLVSAMTIPGILFVEATRSRNAPAAIGTLVDRIQLSPPRAAILIAIGVGVTVESLTGMGVSLLVTVPLLLRLTDRRTAIGLALVGMSLMPWGALAISAHVSAKLSGLPIEQLTEWISAVSGPVAFCLPMLCILLMRSLHFGNIAIALAAGATLSLTIAAGAHWIGIEVAGVVGGLSVIALMVVLADSRTGLGAALTASGLRPYLWLLTAVFAQKIAVGMLASVGLAPTISTGRVSFAMLTSPGVALMAATLISATGAITRPVLRMVAMRSWRPVASIAMFMLSARILVECGAITALAGLLTGLGRGGAITAVTLLGAVGGLITGSGVSASALFMPSAVALGETLGNVPLFAALQNSAGGHVAMASLPVAAILLAALPSRTSDDDVLVMYYGLILAAWHVAVLAAVGFALLA